MSSTILLASLALLGSPAALQEPDLLSEIGISAERAAERGPEGLTYGEELKRTLIYLAGPTQVFQETVGRLLDIQIASMRAAGEDLGRLNLSDAVVQQRIQYSIDQFAKSAPGIDFWEVLDSQGYDRDSYPKEVRRILLLDQLFWPDDPDLWPAVTREMFPPEQRTDEAGKPVFDENGNPVPAAEGAEFNSFVAGTFKTLQQRKEQGSLGSVDEMMKEFMMRPTAIQFLWEKIGVKEPWHGLPEGVALQVGEQRIKTDDLIASVRTRLTQVDIERSVAWLDLSWRIKRALAADNLLLSKEEADKLIEEEQVEYVNSPISWEQMATEFFGFPTVQLYREHFRLRYSFAQTLPSPLPDDVLMEHFGKRASGLANGKAQVDCIFFSAMHPDYGTFSKEGDPFEAPGKRAQEAAAKLADGADWEKVLLQYSDYPDSYPNAPANAPKPDRGRFSAQARVPLRDMVYENEFLDFVLGYSVGDQAFYEAEIGAVYGPVKGAQGWYLFRVMRRVPPDREMDPVNNPNHRFLVTDDHLNIHFAEFVAGLSK